jgi:hypothetical protein
LCGIPIETETQSLCGIPIETETQSLCGIPIETETQSLCGIPIETETQSAFDTDSPSQSGYISLHVWKDKEEDMLVHLRHEQQDLFSKTRNHNRLWHNIAEELCKTFQTKISGTQALNKYNNLKKRWKEIVDAGTGTERKDFRLREEFDLVFGTKPSTRPFATLDSVSSNSPSSPKSLRNTTNSSSQLVPRESRKVPKKRKLQSSKLLEDLTNREEEFTAKIVQFHEEKMQRMDRFLDLFERSLQDKK